MSLSERERKELSWKRNSKGKGLRWIIMRELVAFLSLAWMSISEIQDLMLIHRGLTRNKCRELIEELENLNSICSEKDKNHVTKYGTTQAGAIVWLKGFGNIPVTLVKEVEILQNVRK